MKVKCNPIKKQILIELCKMGITYSKAIFHPVSPYQKRRYKPEYVGWELWLYNGKSQYGFLLTEEDFNNKEYLKDYVQAFIN